MCTFDDVSSSIDFIRFGGGDCVSYFQCNRRDFWSIDHKNSCCYFYYNNKAEILNQSIKENSEIGYIFR